MSNNYCYISRLVFYFLFSFYLVFNANSKNIFTGNGLFCELDNKGDIDNLIQAYYFYDDIPVNNRLYDRAHWKEGEELV